MTDLLVQFIGTVALLIAVGWGYWRWVRPHESRIDNQGKGLLLLLLLTMMGGLLGGIGWWMDDPRAFPWDLPPVASRLLASAGWAFAVVTAIALQRPVFRRVRLILVMLFTYLIPLLLVIVLFHLDRFNFSAPITIGFFVTVTLLVVPTLWYLYQQPQIIPDEIHDSTRASETVQRWLTAVGILTILWGIALFRSDEGVIPLIWAWQGDPLTTRLIAAMLLTIAVGTGYGNRHEARSHMMLAVIVVYGLGIVTANLWNLLEGKPLNIAYTGIFAALSLVSAGLLFLERARDKPVAKVL
jgi:hypothetical protein